jgi:NADH:ubiquinone oxidoreductase subunit F (NADH-binding)
LPAKIPIDPKFDERKRAEAVARIAERSPTDAAFMDWFLQTRVPLGAKELDVLDLPLDLVFFRNMNTTFRLPVEPMLGAAIIVYAGNVDILDQAVNFTEFFRNESCGKCVPCRIGSQKLVQIGTDLLKRREAGQFPTGTTEAERWANDVRDLYRTLQLTSIFGLGYVAPIPLATALTYFPEDLRSKPAG